VIASKLTVPLDPDSNTAVRLHRDEPVPRPLVSNSRAKPKLLAGMSQKISRLHIESGAREASHEFLSSTWRTPFSDKT
jgi:hypothetical protein